MNWKTEMLLQMPGECLVPCGPDKAPLEKAWQQKGYTAQQIAKMGDKVRSVGINTAKAKYVCIDLDGTDAFDFCQAHGLPLLPTWVIGRSNDSTRQKHIYCVSDEQSARLPIDAGKWKKGNLEVFWRSQQFIAAGEHPSGAYYTWDGTPKSVAQLPEAWIEFLPRRRDLAAVTQVVREIDLQSLLTREHSKLVDGGCGGEGGRNDNLFKLAADAYAAEDEALRRQSVDVRIISTADELIQTALAKTDKSGFTRSEIDATLRSAREGRQVTAGFEDRWAFNVQSHRRNSVSRAGAAPASGRVLTKMEGIAELLPDQHDPKGRKMQLDSGALSALLVNYLGDRLAFNQLGYKVELDGEPLRDVNRVELLCMIQNRGYKLSDQMLSEALIAGASRHAYHPVQDYLTGLLEDHSIGTVECDMLAWEFLGAEGTLYGEMLKRCLIGAVQRAMDPGCKMDYICVLHGGQGLGKTTFWNLLFGDWFKVFCAELGDKDSYIGLHDSWGIELGEIDGITSVKQSAKLKNFATTQTDIFRPPFGRVTEKFRRPSILVGSCNRDDFLNDSTGERRYWVIPMRKKLDRDSLIRQRDAIWRTAALLWQRGELPYLSDALEEESAENNLEYSQESILVEPLQKLLRNEFSRGFVRKSTLKSRVMKWELVPAAIADKHIKSSLLQIGWKERRRRGSYRFWCQCTVWDRGLSETDWQILDRDS